MQRLQETHETLLASREQQASSHQAQLQQLVGQERMRQEEVSRCRAQVASLSAELAAERRMAEEGRQQLALVRAEAARYQVQVRGYLPGRFEVNIPTFKCFIRYPLLCRVTSLWMCVTSTAFL